MTPEQFCYWLQGRAELMPDVPINVDEWQVIKDHLQLVFKKETPARVSDFNPHDLMRKAKESAEMQQRAAGISGIIQCGRNQPSIC